MNALDDFLSEINAYDMKWFDEIGGNEARTQLEALRDRENNYHGQLQVKAEQVGILKEEVANLRELLLEAKRIIYDFRYKTKCNAELSADAERFMYRKLAEALKDGGS